MKKVAHYRRAIWSVAGRDVERLMRQALAQAPSVADTKFDYHTSVAAQIAVRSVRNTIGLYFTLFSEGEATGTVENGGGQIGRAKPPAGTEFLKSGIYIVIEGDHLAYVANGHTNDGQITQLIAKFLKSQGVPDKDTQFLFMARPNRRELERLLKVGVKSIDLGLTSFLTAVEEIAGANPRNRLADRRDALVGAVRGIFGRDRSPQEVEAASQIQANLHIGYDGRSASDLVPVLLSDLARQISDGAEEFKIVTKHDAIITREKLIVKRDVTVEGDDISLDPHSAFDALRDCLQEWRNGGIMDD